MKGGNQPLNISVAEIGAKMQSKREVSTLARVTKHPYPFLDLSISNRPVPCLFAFDGNMHCTTSQGHCNRRQNKD